MRSQRRRRSGCAWVGCAGVGCAGVGCAGADGPGAGVTGPARCPAGAGPASRSPAPGPAGCSSRMRGVLGRSVCRRWPRSPGSASLRRDKPGARSGWAGRRIRLDRSAGPVRLAMIVGPVVLDGLRSFPFPGRLHPFRGRAPRGVGSGPPGGGPRPGRWSARRCPRSCGRPGRCPPGCGRGGRCRAEPRAGRRSIGSSAGRRRVLSRAGRGRRHQPGVLAPVPLGQHRGQVRGHRRPRRRWRADLGPDRHGDALAQLGLGGGVSSGRPGQVAGGPWPPSGRSVRTAPAGRPGGELRRDRGRRRRSRLAGSRCWMTNVPANRSPSRLPCADSREQIEGGEPMTGTSQNSTTRGETRGPGPAGTARGCRRR